MSSKSIGRAFEKKVQVTWECHGWLFIRAQAKLIAIGPGKFVTQANDLFGCFDLIGVHPCVNMVAFIQTTTGEASHRLRKIEQYFGPHFNPKAHLVQVWKRLHDKQEIRVRRLLNHWGHGNNEWADEVVSFRDGIREGIFDGGSL